MNAPAHPPSLRLLRHPYRHLTPVSGGREQLRSEGRKPGSVLVWSLAGGVHEQDANVVRRRPGGLPAVVVLPRRGDLFRDPDLLSRVDSVRPLAVLPYHPALEPGEVATLLRNPPQNLGHEVTEYLAWRGLVVDGETRQLIRRTVTLSADLRSISALCRSMYLSRRALGRRFLSRGLPVPSHFLHFSRLLRVAIRLQNTEDSVLSVGYELGYPDAFSLSNQMMRLTGYRPSDARSYLGWEWLLEAWLRREADAGGLAPDFTHQILIEGRPARLKPRRGRPSGESRRDRALEADPDLAVG